MLNSAIFSKMQGKKPMILISKEIKSNAIESIKEVIEKLN